MFWAKLNFRFERWVYISGVMEKICLNIVRCYTLDILRYIQILYKIYKRLIMRIEDGYWKIRVQGKNTRAHTLRASLT